MKVPKSDALFEKSLERVKKNVNLQQMQEDSEDHRESKIIPMEPKIYKQEEDVIEDPLE